MIFSNQTLKTEERKLDFGTIYQVGMGEVGRGRKFMALTCNADDVIIKGLNKHLTIGTTKSGKPRINKANKNDKKLFLMLSSEGGYTRRGNGTIQVLKSQAENYKILAKGNGADGAAGRIGYWDCVLLEAPLTNGIIKVRTSGSGYGTPSDLYIINDDNVYQCTISTLDDCCELLGIEIPCKINAEGFGDDWMVL